MAGFPFPSSSSSSGNSDAFLVVGEARNVVPLFRFPLHPPPSTVSNTSKMAAAVATNKGSYIASHLLQNLSISSSTASASSSSHPLSSWAWMNY